MPSRASAAGQLGAVSYSSVATKLLVLAQARAGLSSERQRAPTPIRRPVCPAVTAAYWTQDPLDTTATRQGVNARPDSPRALFYGLPSFGKRTLRGNRLANAAAARPPSSALPRPKSERTRSASLSSARCPLGNRRVSSLIRLMARAKSRWEYAAWARASSSSSLLPTSRSERAALCASLGGVTTCGAVVCDSGEVPSIGSEAELVGAALNAGVGTRAGGLRNAVTAPTATAAAANEAGNTNRTELRPGRGLGEARVSSSSEARGGIRPPAATMARARANARERTSAGAIRSILRGLSSASSSGSKPNSRRFMFALPLLRVFARLKPVLCAPCTGARRPRTWSSKAPSRCPRYRDRPGRVS